MKRPGIAEMHAFVAIAERGSFAKAATHLGVSRSTLSGTIRELEEKLSVRLFNRTTRSVALTEAGERLLSELRPALESFEAAIDAVNVFRDTPAGSLRLTIPRPAGRAVFEPILAKFLAAYPAIALEIISDSALVDIVRDKFDAGIRPGYRVEQDMIAQRVGEVLNYAVVASEKYLADHPRPKAPSDLEQRNCIRLRFASGVLHPWIFERRGKSIEVMVTGSLTVNDGDLALRAALDGVGIARLPYQSVATDIEARRLIPLLEEWAPRPTELYLYYPTRRQNRPALQAFVDFLKAHTPGHRQPR